MDNDCLGNHPNYRYTHCKHLEINDQDALAGFMLPFSELAVAAPIDLTINHQWLMYEQPPKTN